MITKCSPKFEAIRLATLVNFNDMIAAWGEKFQSAADIATTHNGLVLNGENVDVGEWVVFSPFTQTFTHCTDAVFQKSYIVF